MKYLASENSWKFTRQYPTDSLAECLAVLSTWIEGGGIYDKMCLHENKGEQGWLERKFKVQALIE
jgi:hypothetical protein